MIPWTEITSCSSESPTNSTCRQKTLTFEVNTGGEPTPVILALLLEVNNRNHIKLGHQ